MNSQQKQSSRFAWADHIAQGTQTAPGLDATPGLQVAGGLVPCESQDQGIPALPPADMQRAWTSLCAAQAAFAGSLERYLEL